MVNIRNKINFYKNVITDKIWFYSPVGIKNNKELSKLKGAFKGKRCFVMGNGPSLLKCDLQLLKDELTIASNAHFLIWDQIGFIPDFLTVEDGLVAEDRGPELNAIKSTTKIFPKDLSEFVKKDDKTLYINFDRHYKNFPQFSEEFDQKVYWGGTVSFLNLQLAYYLGCSEIYMIGFDHEYKIPDKIENSVIIPEEDDVNHIHPNYFGKGYRWHEPNVMRMQMSYTKAREFFEKKDIKIFNATVGGKLEVFKRVDYSTLF